MLNNTPDGTHCFVDANVIAYFIASLSPFAPQCETFFNRVEAGVIYASTSAAAVSVQHRLLTNDAITIASMGKLGLTHLATNDDNFDTVPGFTVWKPR